VDVQVETLVGEVAQALPSAAKAAQAAPAGGDAPGRGELPSFREMRQLLLAQGGPQNLSSQVGRRADPACISITSADIVAQLHPAASSANEIGTIILLIHGPGRAQQSSGLPHVCNARRKRRHSCSCRNATAGEEMS